MGLSTGTLIRSPRHDARCISFTNARCYQGNAFRLRAQPQGSTPNSRLQVIRTAGRHSHCPDAARPLRSLFNCRIYVVRIITFRSRITLGSIAAVSAYLRHLRCCHCYTILCFFFSAFNYCGIRAARHTMRSATVIYDRRLIAAEKAEH